MQHAIAVIMCTYQRPERLRETIAQLESQAGVGIKLHIWNNNLQIRDEIDKELAESHSIPIRVTHSDTNVGGFGRFLMARQLADLEDNVLFIDDDVNIPPETVRIFLNEYKQKTISSFYAFQLRSPKDFFERDELRPGQQADYCGTGGMICDSSIFKEEGLFNCPDEYRFIEDLWLSYYARHIMNWSLYKSAAPIQLLDDEHGQWKKLYDKKSEFLQYLVNQGWQLLGQNNE